MSKPRQCKYMCIKLPRYYATENLIVKVNLPAMELIATDPEIGNSTRVTISIENLLPILKGCFDYIVLTISYLIKFYKHLVEIYQELPTRIRDKVSREELEEKVKTLEGLLRELPTGQHMDAILSTLDVIENILLDPKLEPVIQYYIQRQNPYPLRGVL